MLMDLNWFQLGPIPADAISGYYSYGLVVLSYLTAVLASYVALDLVGRLQAEQNKKIMVYWLIGGSFAMGAGIWSMHFIGMLSFNMPMPMSYDFFWTALSLIVAVLASALALFILRRKEYSLKQLELGGILFGAAIVTMHYTGMEGMKSHVNIHYLPSLFFLSIAIAIAASGAALWLALKSNDVEPHKQFNLKIVSALMMGAAICGMHYTGMAAAIFTPLPIHEHIMAESIPQNLLAFFIAGITASIIGLALTVSTYYKQTVDAIQNEKRFLNAMLDNIDDGIIACNARGNITVLNDSLQKNILSGRIANVYEWQNCFELFTPEDDKRIEVEDFPLLKALNGEHVKPTAYIMAFNEGVTRDVIIEGQPIINRDGNNLGAVIVIHDVTGLKKTEKLKNEFISIVSHELRTPLTSIRGSLGLIKSGVLGSFEERARKLLDIADTNCDRLLLLINDILDIEKIEAGKMNFQLRLVDIGKLVADTISDNALYGEKYDVGIRLTSTVNDVMVQVDPVRIEQVLSNLISNAVKFSPQGGKVDVAMEIIAEKVRISVIDKGEGIPLEFQAHIFQKFSQADTSTTRGKGGTGLGLSISKAILDKVGVELNFKSKPNEGSVFYFDLPIYQVDANSNKCRGRKTEKRKT